MWKVCNLFQSKFQIVQTSVVQVIPPFIQTAMVKSVDQDVLHLVHSLSQISFKT
jgi:hypothetical protein